jgi:hypothetical protein
MVEMKKINDATDLLDLAGTTSTHQAVLAGTGKLITIIGREFSYEEIESIQHLLDCKYRDTWNSVTVDGDNMIVTTPCSPDYPVAGNPTIHVTGGVKQPTAP